MNLNPYYKDLCDHPDKIHPRLEGETTVNLLKMGLDALVVQERNRMKEMEDTNEKGNEEKEGSAGE